MSASQHAWNVENIATVSTVTIETTLNTSNSTKTTITLREKLLKMNLHASTKAVLAESQVAQKNTASATKPDFSVGIFANVSSAKTTNR